MKYAVFLDPNSIIGQTYLQGKNDGVTKSGSPMLHCLSMEAEGPYLAVTRDLSSIGKSDQLLLIPHHAVAWIQQFSEGDPKTVGFL